MKKLKVYECSITPWRGGWAYLIEIEGFCIISSSNYKTAKNAKEAAKRTAKKLGYEIKTEVKS
jgi:hypothetical protein